MNPYQKYCYCENQQYPQNYSWNPYGVNQWGNQFHVSEQIVDGSKMTLSQAISAAAGLKNAEDYVKGVNAYNAGWNIHKIMNKGGTVAGQLSHQKTLWYDDQLFYTIVTDGNNGIITTNINGKIDFGGGANSKDWDGNSILNEANKTPTKWEEAVPVIVAQIAKYFGLH